MNMRLVQSLGVYALWVLVTLLGAKWMLGGEEAGLEELVKNGIGWQFVGASALLLAAIAFFRWNDLKFSAPYAVFTVMWLPVLLLLAISSVIALTGFPSRTVTFYVLFNTFLVGFSEEVMFRGILFRALLESLRIWPAIIVTSLLFGAVHSLNGVNTGDWGGALLQSVTAAMSGMIFIAIVLRHRLDLAGDHLPLALGRGDLPDGGGRRDEGTSVGIFAPGSRASGGGRIPIPAADGAPEFYLGDVALAQGVQGNR